MSSAKASIISSPVKQSPLLDRARFVSLLLILNYRNQQIARIFWVSWQYYKVMFKATQQKINGSLYQPQKLHHYCTEFPEQHRGSLVNLGDMENACIKKD